MDPIFRWAGSKKKQLARLTAFWDSSYERYIEPFAGSAALFFRLEPTKAILTDLNSELIQAYQAIKLDPEHIHSLVSKFEISSDSYYRLRRVNPKSLTLTERAARFLYLNRLCFNGIYRTNRAGEFNVPFGGKKIPPLPGIESLRQCALMLEQTEIVHCDFGKTLSRARMGDFVYLDPPYTTDMRRVFKEYGPKEFTLRDLQRLSEHLLKMHNRGVHFVLSYADCKEAREAFAIWRPNRIRVRRNIAGFSNRRRYAYELLVTNIPAKSPQRETNERVKNRRAS